jgi:ArsR family transcriptional regulator, arsenate/arsenite/antimonite-responsive transcriptional repressor / arsenate reductase (thioredoxin)
VTRLASGSTPPSFLPLAGHPVRWAVLKELAHSDRTVGELCALLERPQNLVSYHLRRLRTERIVSCRRSAADARDTYYTLDLRRCGELLSAAADALHPGLRASPAPLIPPSGPPDRRPARVRILFLCTGNSARSQMAEALAQQRGGGGLEAYSAGSHPKPLHPNAVRVMRGRGIDIEGRRSKHMSEFTAQSFDRVVTLCDRVREVCPEFPGRGDLIHWSIPDPAREGASDEESYPAFERTADELDARIPFLLELIAHNPPDPDR